MRADYYYDVIVEIIDLMSCKIIAVFNWRGAKIAHVSRRVMLITEIALMNDVHFAI